MPLLTTLTWESDKAQISMAEVGEPTQYGYAERLMRTIKEEEVDLSEYRDYHDVYQHIGQFIEDVYMHKRVHSALGYLTPAEFEQQWLALPVNERATLCCPVLWGQYRCLWDFYFKLLKKYRGDREDAFCKSVSETWRGFSAELA